MNVTFVTCLFDDLWQTRFGGRCPSIQIRYRYGLEALAMLGAKIDVYTWPSNVKNIENNLKDRFGKPFAKRTFQVLPFDLEASPYFEEINSLKDSIGNECPPDRSLHITAAKFLFLENSIQKNKWKSSSFFWIDVGLSHSVIFPHRFLKRGDGDGDRGNSLCSLFTPSLSRSLEEASKEKVLLFRLEGSTGHKLDPDLLNSKPKMTYPWYIIGGLFGGRKEQIKKYCKEMSKIGEVFRGQGRLFLEEQIMTFDASYNESSYTFLEFETWNHEDSGAWCQERIKGKRKFYNIIEDLNR